MLELLKDEPEFIPVVFYHLFDGDNPHALEIAAYFFEASSTQNRIMLFRELAKSNMSGAQNLLERFLKKEMTPYEEVTLGSYTYFPIRKSKVDQFKKRKEASLDEQLSFLEFEFSYIHSEAVKQQAKVGFSNNNKIPEDWEEKTADEKARFNFLKKGEGQQYLKTKWRMVKDSSLAFYLSVNQDVRILINGKENRIISANHRASVIDKIVDLPLSKGKNEIIVQFSAKENTSLSFHNAGDKYLIDPKLKLKEVEHLALDATAKYIKPYSYKYHGNGVALTDGLRGTTDYGSQLWQGWFGEEAEIIFDLGVKKQIKEIEVGLLSNQRSWIFYPKKIAFSVSQDGKEFIPVYKETFEKIRKLDVAAMKGIIGSVIPQKVRYVKVIVTPIDALPGWHESKGEKSWIFLDEVMVR